MRKGGLIALSQILKDIHAHHTNIFQLWESNPRPWTQKEASPQTAASNRPSIPIPSTPQDPSYIAVTQLTRLHCDEMQ
ncbi:jg19711 [Pararge aegeria aegeria]|uniref:Jg19711 protein n=1 Tax=Pararge aegeria aegeria TaxID=348720 RepID=A0A8S4R5Q8_9NEOP|nr:jg19711 [Pararge aegeria aegeria]